MTPPAEAMAGIERRTIGGRAADILVIDDPMHGLIGEPGPVDRSKPDSLETMIRRGDFVARHGDSAAVPPKPRLAGTLAYSPKEDELGQVKLVDSAGIVSIWFGQRRANGEEIIHGERACDLYVIATRACNSCRGMTGRRGFSGWVPCKICNGLRTVPTADGLKPWAAEKRERLARGEL